MNKRFTGEILTLLVWHASKGLYDAKIMPKDELTILVQTTDPLSSEPFNLHSTGQSTNKNAITGYLVDNDGMD